MYTQFIYNLHTITVLNLLDLFYGNAIVGIFNEDLIVNCQ